MYRKTQNTQLDLLVQAPACNAGENHNSQLKHLVQGLGMWSLNVLIRVVFNLLVTYRGGAPKPTLSSEVIR